ncbi:MAG: CMD domain protein [Yoonia sp.]|uniref:CMD domain protein n=1 Tax=Yoonia sp. TaxID=2212373 RepID=UPI003EF62EEF
MNDAFDVIDQFSGLPDGSELRAARPTAREFAQKSNDALFGEPGQGMVSKDVRLMVAYFVASLHQDASAISHYAKALAESTAAGMTGIIDNAAKAGLTTGPYGAFPEGPLSVENVPGLIFFANVEELGPMLAPVLDHAHMLVFHPRDAARDHIKRLSDAGWSATQIVTLSQLISFLCFQIRAGSGLRVLANCTKEA